MKKQFGMFLGGIALVMGLAFATSNETKAAFGGERTPPIGKDCIVQFRRDALGAAAALPVAPTTGSINGAQTAIGGKLLMVNSEWVLLNNGNDLWIPTASVLLI